MKKHYVTRWEYLHRLFPDAACGILVCTYGRFKNSTYRKNHVTCGNCRRTKVFRGVK